MRRELDRDYTLEEVADALGMSTRWVRDRIRLDGAAHQRYGRLIRFTPDQVAALRAAHVRSLVSEPVTTGPVKGRHGMRLLNAETTTSAATDRHPRRSGA